MFIKKGVRVFSEDIRMEHDIGKCAILVIEKGKIMKSAGIELPEVIESLQEGEIYNILEF